jgi:hypothetical protein
MKERRAKILKTNRQEISMARVYYKEEKLYGSPVETSIINLKNFNTLIENRKNIPQTKFDLKKDGKGSHFRFFHASDDGIYYKSDKGTFYLPKALMFYDADDFVFPSTFYFIALIGNDLEIRYVNGGDGVAWFHIPELHKEVKDTKIIEKMESTIEVMLAYFAEYKEPKKKKIKGISLQKERVEEFLGILGVEKHYADGIVKMASSPTDYFDKNEDALYDYEIFDPSENMYLLYLVNLLEKKKIIKSVDWKQDFEEIVYALERLSGIPLGNIDGKKFKNKAAGEILSDLSKEIEKREIEKLVYCIDTYSDSYSFGAIKKDVLSKLIQTGDGIHIKVYEPKK